MGSSQSGESGNDDAEPLGRFWAGPDWDDEPLQSSGPRITLLLVVLLAVIGLAVLGGSVVFLFGEDLFGSDRRSIDSYNREVLDTCDVPPGSTLLRTFTAPTISQSGQPLWSMSDVFASPLSASDVAAFYGIEEGVGTQHVVSSDKSCRFGNRPSLLVLSQWTAQQGTVMDPEIETTAAQADSGDDFWGGKAAAVTAFAEPPDQTQSFFRLRLAQQEVEGIFD